MHGPEAEAGLVNPVFLTEEIPEKFLEFQVILNVAFILFCLHCLVRSGSLAPPNRHFL